MDEQEEFEFRLRLEQESAAQVAPKAAPPKQRLQAPGIIGAGLDAGLHMASSGLGNAVGGLMGLGASIGNAFGATNTDPVDLQQSIASKMSIGPFTPQGEALSSAISYLPEKWAQISEGTGQAVATASDSPLIGAGVNTGLQALPAIVGGRGAFNSRSGLGPVTGRPRPPSAVPQPKAGLGSVPPTLEELSKQSTAAYARAKKAGADIAPESFEGLKTRIGAMAKEEGINAKLHPDAAAVLDDITGTEGAVSLQQLETLRKIANDARGSAKPADSRIAGKIVDEIDDYMDGVGQKDLTSGSPEGFAALKEARNLYSRKMKAEEIQELVRRAEISAPNFSGSGMENALRTEFRALAKNKNKMRRFTKEEQLAIERVAKGGAMENVLRMFGKFAPTGIVSTALSTGLGAIAGGGVGAVGLPTAGMAARLGATRMTKANAMRAEELMRRGPQPSWRIEPTLEESRLGAPKVY